MEDDKKTKPEPAIKWFLDKIIEYINVLPESLKVFQKFGTSAFILAVGVVVFLGGLLVYLFTSLFK